VCSPNKEKDKFVTTNVQEKLLLDFEK